MKHFRLLLLSIAISLPLAAQAPRGEGWTSETIASGVSYYTFSGIEDISGAAQQIFVIDLDLSDPRNALRFSYSAEDVPTSAIFKKYDALAAINAGYEASSIVIKVDDQMHSCMPFDYVFTSPVPNWKSEGAVYTDGNRDVRIAFDGKGMSIAEQRDFYASSTESNILTSAPMLIDNYAPVGAYFVDASLSMQDLKALHYEDPARHQGVRHPRTAIAKTADNHIILVAVDGRREGIGEGMSARELTMFLVKWFNPKYALNLDGGGSTTMCVRGHGDPETCVVNYPTDNKQYDHAGERRRDTHIYIIRLPVGEPREHVLTPRLGVRNEVRADWNKCSGLDCVYDMNEKASTPAPKGYEPVYVSHYGRHGSRFAYHNKAYTYPLNMLREAAAKDNLTPYGERLLKDLEDFWATAQYQVGDLTPLGWQQHQYIATTMVRSFPSAFGKGSTVDACSSPSTRAIVSMSSFVSAISREAPKTTVYAHQSLLDVQAARPNAGSNPFRYKGPAMPLPYGETSEHFFLRHFPQYEEVLGRLLKDPSGCLGDITPFDMFFNLYMFVAGMNSLPEEMRIDVDGIFTQEEYATLWEIDNYERFREYYNYKTPCSSIVDDIVAKADARLASASRGADLRFGHDHVVMSLLMIMDIDGFGYVPENPDDLVYWFQTFRSCMATNLQFVFYQPKKCKRGEDILVKLLFNGEEATIGTLEPVSGPYYRWSDVRAFLQKRVEMFATR